MPDLVPFTDALFVWPKGTTYFGEPLPYLVHTADGKPMAAYGDWWTPKRVDLLNAWASDCHHPLLRLCGTDPMIEVMAKARVMREEAEATGVTLTLPQMMAWCPEPRHVARLSTIRTLLADSRERIRSSILEASRLSSEVAGDLSGEPDEWSPVQMAFAAMRLPKLLLALADEGLIPSPAAIVPSHARN